MSLDPAAGFDRARTLAAVGRLEEAVSLLSSVLAADPTHCGALVLRASLHAEERDWGEVLALNQRAAALWPRSAEALNALARCLHALGRDPEALEVAQRAQGVLGEGENFVQTAAVYLTLVWCFREMRRYQEAIAAAEEGLARMPDAVLAQWATQVEDELVAAQRERC
jgi:tetratricopeptide (TPR) repeat protein